MKFVLGIGHSEQDKSLIRHNAGYQVLDWFCQKYNIDLQPEKWDFFKFARTNINDNEVCVAKLCVKSHEIGKYLAQILKIWNINIDDLVVIHDDNNIDFGRIILCRSGNGGNHTAVNSIIDALKTKHFTRIRVGIGHKKGMPERKYLLGPYSDKQYQKLPKIFELAVDELEKVINNKK